METNADTIMPSQWIDLHASDNDTASPLRRICLNRRRHDKAVRRERFSLADIEAWQAKGGTNR